MPLNIVSLMRDHLGNVWKIDMKGREIMNSYDAIIDDQCGASFPFRPVSLTDQAVEAASDKLRKIENEIERRNLKLIEVQKELENVIQRLEESRKKLVTANWKLVSVLNKTDHPILL